MTAVANAPISNLLKDSRDASPPLWNAALIFVALFALTYAATFIDPRLIYGVSVWDKPAKFFLSTGLHMATLAWGLSLLPANARAGRGVQIAVALFIAMAIFELGYISLQAARGQSSHFNYTSAFYYAMFILMGVGASILALVTSFIGWRILKFAPASPLGFAAGLGFLISGVLTLAAGLALSANKSHWVGGDQTDSTGLLFFHYSTTGGDLRPAHFLANHIMQFLPLVGFLVRKRPLPQARVIVWLAAIVWIALTIFTFAQARMGRPLFG